MERICRFLSKEDKETLSPKFPRRSFFHKVHEPLLSYSSSVNHRSTKFPYGAVRRNQDDVFVCPVCGDGRRTPRSLSLHFHVHEREEDIIIEEINDDTQSEVDDTSPPPPTERMSVVNSPPDQAIRRGVTLFSELPFNYDSLEPYINTEIMELHHSRHHQAYVNGFNAAKEELKRAFLDVDLTQQLSLQCALKFNGGGHINHALFWENLAPKGEGGGGLPDGALSTAINAEFGSFDEFVKHFDAAAAGIQGSGWVWLGYNKASKRVEIATTPNEDHLLHLSRLLSIDLWEHAYYLQYKNVRSLYIKNIFEVVNWTTVARRFSIASGV